MNEKARSESGRFERRCGSSCHDKNINPSLYLVDLRKRKGISAKNYQKLLELGFVVQSTHYICQSCIKIGLKRNGEGETPEIKENIEREDLDTFNKIMNVGELIRKEIYTDLKDQGGKSLKCFEDIISYQPLNWLGNRPQNLVHLISSICGIDLNVSTPEKAILVCKIIEIIYGCVNQKLVLPNHFIENLLCYSYTNCKTYINFLGDRSPGGAYTYIKNWLKAQSKEPLKFPEGLVKAVFDNNQKIGKTYLISGTNTVPASIITSHLWITLDKESKLQKDINLSPKSWIYNKLSAEKQEELKCLLLEPTVEFKRTRNHFINSCIKTITDEKKTKGEQSKADIDPYKSFIEEPRTPDLCYMAGEPDFVNPNSFYDIIQILKGIGIRAGIRQYGKGSRDWLMVECDGVPYNLIRSLINEVQRCEECNECFFGTASFKDHCCYILNKVNAKYEFAWVVPVSGLLHLEINLGRAFLKLNWDVFFRKVGMTVGFTSTKALQYLHKGADHHKLWHLFEIVYISLGLELMSPYVESCEFTKKVPSYEDYWSWSQSVKNPNYVYMQHVLSHLHALMTLRAGVRKCYYNYVRDAISKLAPIVYARNHPIYQNILYSNAHDLILMPKQLRDVLQNFLSGSKKKIRGKCQGGDATLEELNKESKSWLKMAGIPNNEQWLHVFRNMDNLNMIKDMFTKDEVNDEDSLYKRNNSIQIMKVRHLFSKYLSDPMEAKVHMDIEGKEKLCDELINFMEIASGNVKKYIEGKTNPEKEDLKLNHVNVTEQEKIESEKIENKTIKEITYLIYERISQLAPEQKKLHEDIFVKTIKRKSKKTHISFYYQLCEVADDIVFEEEQDNEL